MENPPVFLSCAVPHPCTECLVFCLEIITFIVDDVKSHETTFVVKSFNFTFSKCISVSLPTPQFLILMLLPPKWFSKGTWQMGKSAQEMGMAKATKLMQS